MGILQVGLLGGVRVTHNNWNTEIQLARENQGLLAYLLLQRHRVHSREVLADLFWGENSQERARGSLNTALWKLKKALEPEGIPAGTYLKKSKLGEVGFNKDSQYWLDVEVFEDGLNRILARPFQTVQESHLADFQKILGLYKGDLLEGYYKDWALRERERLRALYVRSLIYLLQYYEFYRSYEKAIAYGRQILDLDPLREEIHRVMMRLYVENGQRILALRQYEICRATLAKELGISPMEDTQLLYAQIATGSDYSLASMISRQQFAVDQAIQQLRDASQTIDLAKDKIQKALQLIIKYSENQD
ncbi:MAG TPA: BTAD domain-containing putative transcriptional regulator [Anaerolineales bacterium]|nr:BTAD domain-containing putative transcriptional regulator [Anaerolineales bacterium]